MLLKYPRADRGLAGLRRHCKGGAATGNVFAPSPCTSTMACQTRFGDGDGEHGMRCSPLACGCTVHRKLLHAMSCHGTPHPQVTLDSWDLPGRPRSRPLCFGVSRSLPSSPTSSPPSSMPSSSVCGGNASAASLGALKRLNVPFLFRYLRAHAWQHGPTPPLIELAEIDQLMVGIKIPTSPTTHTSPLPQSI